MFLCFLIHSCSSLRREESCSQSSHFFNQTFNKHCLTNMAESTEFLRKIGKRKRFHYAKYVNYDKETNYSECLVCRKQMKSLSTGNIKRHYLKMHSKNLDTDADSRIPSNPVKRMCKMRLSMNKSEFLTSCIGLVSVRNIPFTIFDDEDYFKKLISPFEDEYDTKLNSVKIQEYLNTTVSKLRSIFSEEIRDRMVCLKLDVINRGSRGVVAMNIIFMEDFKIITQTIGMVEMKSKSESRSLLIEIMKCLAECGLNESLIYSTTIDSSSHVYLPQLTDFNNDSVWEEEYDELHSMLTDVAHCASRNIHLAANDVMTRLTQKLSESREIVTTLQAKYPNLVEENIPLGDSPTRWLTTYYFFESLVKIKTRVEALKITWTFVNEFLASFKPLVEYLQKLREVNYIIGDFYRDWLCCEIELEELSGKNIYAGLLLQALQEKKAEMLESSSFLAALYMDQRFNFIKTPFLTEGQQMQALDHILTTLANLNGTKIKDEYSSDEGERSMDVSISNDPFMKLEEKTKSMIGSLTPSLGKTVKEKLEGLRFGDRLSFHVDILNHWRCLTYEDSEMKQLVEIVLASPCTQASAERTIKEVHNISTNPSSEGVANEAISNMLMVRMNSNVLKFVNLDV